VDSSVHLMHHDPRDMLSSPITHKRPRPSKKSVFSIFFMLLFSFTLPTPCFQLYYPSGVTSSSSTKEVEIRVINVLLLW